MPVTTGSLQPGRMLVSNFNDVSNAYGTGTTVVQISPTGGVKTFARLSAPLPFVVAGSLPAANGSANAQAGCLIVLDHNVTRSPHFAATESTDPGI